MRTVTFMVAAALCGCSVDIDGDGFVSSAAESSSSADDTTAASDASTDTPGSTGSDDSTQDDTDPLLFDIGSVADIPPMGCGEADAELELSYIWIANSTHGTISKIDTQTLVEEGRYRTRQNWGDPSRTSVNFNGDVAVANRHGGVTKVWADVGACVETNGIPGIQTSTGRDDVLAWGEEECVAWHTPLSCIWSLPVAWTPGTWNPSTCSHEDAKLWTVCDGDVLLLDGETGAIEQTAELSGTFPYVYGGASDADGNFWGLEINGARLVRVDAQDYGVDEWPLPPTLGYGITVDAKGRPWVCGGGGVSRFDPLTSQWASTGGSGMGGCMTDGATTLWHSNPQGVLLGFDIETLDVVAQIPLPAYVHGVSVDFHGNVWGVTFNGTTTYRTDPVTGTIDSYEGLTGAYTYSDMTGFALAHAGVGTPAG